MVDNANPFSLLFNRKFEREKIESKYPNSRRHLLDGLFISHSGLDRQLISKLIIPIIDERFFPERFFFHSRLSGGAEAYVEIVQAALHYCNKFMVVLSHNSISNDWVKAEVTWAVFHKRPIILCSLDDINPAQLYPDFKSYLDNYSEIKIYYIDFNSGIEIGQKALKQVLDKLLK